MCLSNLGKYLKWQSLLDNYSTFAYYLSSDRGSNSGFSTTQGVLPKKHKQMGTPHSPITQAQIGGQIADLVTTM